jgi:CubicO group peptidase (beta-lactamase class C family)
MKHILFLLISIAFFYGCKQKHIRSTAYNYSTPIDLLDGIKVTNSFDLQIDKFELAKITKLILSDTIPNIHSLLILKDNHLIYENYFEGEDEKVGKKLGYISHSANDLHDCRSITKSITSACIGIAVTKGLIENIDDPIYPYFKQEYQNKFDDKKKKITIRNLLTMTSGLKWNEDISYRDPRNTELRMDISTDPIDFILGRPMVHEPGETWNYNGGNTQLLADIIKSVSGLSIDKFAEKELFEPLGINRYEWMTLTDNMPAAASGLRLTSRDLLKIGMLYMNNGLWNKKILINPEWINLSLNSEIRRSSTKDTNAGYGFQFWTSEEMINGKAIYIQEAKGNGGQRIFFCKSLNLLVVITAGNYNNWDIKNDSKALLINHIIPAIK